MGTAIKIDVGRRTFSPWHPFFSLLWPKIGLSDKLFDQVIVPDSWRSIAACGSFHTLQLIPSLVRYIPSAVECVSGSFGPDDNGDEHKSFVSSAHLAEQICLPSLIRFIQENNSHWIFENKSADMNCDDSMKNDLQRATDDERWRRRNARIQIDWWWCSSGRNRRAMIFNRQRTRGEIRLCFVSVKVNWLFLSLIDGFPRRFFNIVLISNRRSTVGRSSVLFLLLLLSSSEQWTCIRLILISAMAQAK